MVLPSPRYSEALPTSWLLALLWAHALERSDFLGPQVLRKLL